MGIRVCNLTLFFSTKIKAALDFQDSFSVSYSVLIFPLRTSPFLLCHISNPHAKHENDVIYPTNFRETHRSDTALNRGGERIHFHGLDRSDYFYLSDSIYWIEAASGGKHSILHTVNDTVEIMATVASLEKQYSHLFLRCHQSYLINPHFLRNIRRFELTLTDGTVLPIPEKKFTAFRAAAKKAIGH